MLIFFVQSYIYTFEIVPLLFFVSLSLAFNTASKQNPNKNFLCILLAETTRAFTYVHGDID